MKKKMLLGLLIMLMVISISSIVSAAPNWVYLDTNQEMKIYIDDNRMDSFENNYGDLIIDYWLATKLSPEGKSRILQWAYDANTYVPWMDDMDCLIIHIKTNVNTKRENQVMIYAYDKDNNLLNSEPGYITNIKPNTNSAWWNAKAAQHFLEKMQRSKYKSTNV